MTGRAGVFQPKDSYQKGSASMIEQLKKALTTGIGLALKTWTEVEAAGKEIIQKAQLSEKDAGKLLKNLRESYEKTQKKMEMQAHRLVKDVLKKADVATSDDVKSLKREIQSLRKEIREARATKGRKPGKAASKSRSKTKPSA
jgi:polyhydroxyalkanoate synthesis regulator phasin